MSLSISLNKPPGTPYMPGETIKGIVTVDMVGTKTCSCDSMILTVRGLAKSEFIEISYYGRGAYYRYEYAYGYQHSTVKDVYKASENYLNGTINLLGKGTLARGRTVFPFEYSLPSQALPMTYTAPNGSIDYEIQVHMCRPKPEQDLQEEVPFTIGAFLDLNRISLANYGPVRFSDQKSVEQGCCCWSTTGPIGIQIVTGKRYVIPGELVEFTVTTENKSNLRLLSGTMDLILKVTCKAEEKTQSYPQSLQQMVGPEVAPLSSQTWVVKDFMIPALKPHKMPPSGLGGCNIITVDYGLKYTAHLEKQEETFSDGPKAVLDAFIPLILGTIPVNT